jgi:NADH-quinone oxidoreductase subunit K
LIIKTINLIIILNFLVSSVGLFGIFINKNNLLLILIAIELIFLGVNLNFILISIYLDDIIGQIFVFFILTIVAGESAIALSLFTIIYKFRKTISMINIQEYFINKI